MKSGTFIMPDGESVEYRESCGNIFADLGLPNPEERLLKAQLAMQIQEHIERKHLTQQQAASLVGLTQPKISDILRGRLSGYSVAKLLSILNRLGCRVEVRISKKEYAPEEARTVVVVA